MHMTAMNSLRNLTRCRRSIHELLFSLQQSRQFVTVHTGILDKISSHKKSNNIVPVNVDLPLTWSVCCYAKKAGKEKKGKISSKVVKAQLTQNEIGDILDLDSVKQSMQDVVDKLKDDYLHVLNIRTTTGAFERVVVHTDDGRFKLSQLAQIEKKSPQLIMVNMSSSPQYTKQVLKSLSETGMNVNPYMEKTTIFVPIPRVTREHREKLAKDAKKMFNQTKTHLDGLYAKHTKTVNSKKKTHSEDLIRNLNSMILDIKQERTAESEKLMEAKQKELLGE